MPMFSPEEKEEIAQIITSVVKQHSHNMPSTATLERLQAGDVRMSRIEESINNHTKEEAYRSAKVVEQSNYRFDNIEDLLHDMKGTLKETLSQVKKTNGRVTALETWKSATVSFANGVKAGGKGVWIGIASIVAIFWVVFGEFFLKKVGLR